MSKPGAGFAWRFHSGLRMLRRAYKSSRVTADKEKANIERRAAEFQKKVDAGTASWIEYTEDGKDSYDYGEQLWNVLDDEESVLHLVRLAFVISLNHYFEQQLSAILPNNKYAQAKAFSRLKGYGWKPLETELNELRLAANCAKHSEGASAKTLYALRSDMFDTSKIKMGFEPGYDSLALSDAHVESFFNAVKQSVPDNLGMVL